MFRKGWHRSPRRQDGLSGKLAVLSSSTDLVPSTDRLQYPHSERYFHMPIL